MLKDKYILGTVSIVTVTIITGAFLSSIKVSATDDSVVDNININVPISCSMEGNGMTSHNANIVNGTYQANIGTTTLKAFCNDNEGFAIYAIGYTDNTDGKNVLTNSALEPTHDIATGTAISGSTSNWAMKLSGITNPIPTYPITIENGFSDYHSVPNDYIKVAKRTSATDIGAFAEGSTLTATYQAYISPTQSAGSYSGKVKYILVHPNYADKSIFNNAVTLIYNGNGSSFTDGSTTNTVKYANVCKPAGYGYVGQNATISKTPNVNNDGTAISGYAYNFTQRDPVTISGADKLKIVLDYGIETDYDKLYIFKGVYNGEIENNLEAGQIATFTGGNGQDENQFLAGEATTLIVDGDTVTFAFYGDDFEDSGYYGYYAKVYPVYNTQQPGTTGEELPSNDCFVSSIFGTYKEIVDRNEGWLIYDGDSASSVTDELDIMSFIARNYNTVKGKTFNVIPNNPYTIHYDGNNATAGIMEGVDSKYDFYNDDDTYTMVAPNFKKDGYGFAGWSTDENASINSSSIIYGPNETVQLDNLFNGGNTHEVNLYAVWVQSAGTMQNWSGCSSLNNGQVTALSDNRDNNVYTIGKMQDGNCWMMENLRLDSNYSSDITKAQGFGGAFIGLANSEDNNYNQSTAANSLYNKDMIGGDSSYYRFPRYNNNNTNIGGTNSNGVLLTPSPGCVTSHQSDCSSDHNQWYSYGNYYTWSAAMANTDMFYNNSESETANTSICPRGWVLPYGKTNGSGTTNGGFAYLDIQMGGNGIYNYSDENNEIYSNNWRSYPKNFVFSGDWINNHVAEIGTFAAYWSRSNLPSESGYGLGIRNNYRTFDDYNKYHGSPVRCIIINNN